MRTVYFWVSATFRSRQNGYWGGPVLLCNLGAAGQGGLNDKKHEEKLDERYHKPIHAGPVTRATDWKWSSAR